MITDDYISLSRAGSVVPGGVSPISVWRWYRYGLVARSGQRIYLKAARAGKKIVTKIEWLDEFMIKLGEMDGEHFHDNTIKKVRTAKQRQADQDIYDAFLVKEGIISGDRRDE